MADGSERWPTLVRFLLVAVVGLAVGATLGRLIFGTWGVLTSSTAAAWAQALGTVAAIAGAVIATNIQVSAAQNLEEKRELRDEQTLTRRATALAARIAVILMDVEQELKKAEGVCDVHIKHFSQGKADGYELGHATLGALVTPDIFENLWAFPVEDILQISHTLYAIQRYDRGVHSTTEYFRNASAPEKVVELAQRIKQNIATLREDLNKSFEILAKYGAALTPNFDNL